VFRCYRCGDSCGDGGRSWIVGRMYLLLLSQQSTLWGTVEQQLTDTFITSYYELIHTLLMFLTITNNAWNSSTTSIFQ
jgi:hypothetical protein